MKQGMSNFYLRALDPEDTSRILSWCKDQRSFRLWSADRFDDYPATSEELLRQFDSDSIFPLVAVMDNDVVGHVMLRYPTADRTLVRLGFVIVDDTKRRLGYGKRMLRSVIRQALTVLGAKRITLGVFSNNFAAIKCYESIGFRVTGEEDYIIDGEVWTCLEMELNNIMETDR